MLFTGRQTRWDVLTWDILTRNTLTWDVLTPGHFDSSGTFWLGTFWLWDILTSVFTKMFAISNLIKYSENILGTFWLTKNGMFWQITWDILVLGRFDWIPPETLVLTFCVDFMRGQLWNLLQTVEWDKQNPCWNLLFHALRTFNCPIQTSC